MRSGTRESHDLSGSHRGWSPRAIAGAIFSSTVSIGIGACAAIAGIDAPMDRADGGTAPDDGGAVRDVADRDAEGGKPVVPIAVNEPGAWAIALDGTNVYWTINMSTGGSVKKCAIAGCNNNPTILASGQSGPNAIAVNGDDVFWTNSTGLQAIMKCSISGCNDNPTPLAVNQVASGIAVDATNVYWAAGDVRMCAVAGCNSNPTTIAMNQNAIRVAIDSTSIYWLSDATPVKCPLAGCAGQPTPLSTAGGCVGFGIALDMTNVYWTTRGCDGIRACAKSGCGAGPIDLAMNQYSADGIAADTTGVYWATNNGAIVGCSASCNNMPFTLASSESPLFVAVDATNVYWTDRSGKILKVAK